MPHGVSNNNNNNYDLAKIDRQSKVNRDEVQLMKLQFQYAKLKERYEKSPSKDIESKMVEMAKQMQTLDENITMEQDREEFINEFQKQPLEPSKTKEDTPSEEQAQIDKDIETLKKERQAQAKNRLFEAIGDFSGSFGGNAVPKE